MSEIIMETQVRVKDQIRRKLRCPHCSKTRVIYNLFIKCGFYCRIKMSLKLLPSRECSESSNEGVCCFERLLIDSYNLKL